MPPQRVIGAVNKTVRSSGSYEPIEKLRATANVFAIGPSLSYDLDVFGRLRRTIEALAAQTTQVAHQALNVRITSFSARRRACFGSSSARSHAPA